MRTLTTTLLIAIAIAAPATAQDSAGLQREIDLAIAAGKPPVLRLEDRRYELDVPLDFHEWREGAAIIGQGFGTELICKFNDRRSPMLDFIGCTRVTIRDLVIRGGSPTNPTNLHEPACGILFARNTRAGSAGGHVVERVWFRGRFVLACIANLASEGNRFVDVEFVNHEGPSRRIDGLPHGGHLLYVANADYHGWLDRKMGESTMLTMWLDNCYFHKVPVANEDRGGCDVMVYAQAAKTVGDLHFRGINAGSHHQRAMFAFDIPQVFDINNRSIGGSMHVVTIEASRFEGGSTDVFLLCRGGRGMANLRVSDTQIYCRETAFDFDDYCGSAELTNLRLTRTTADTLQPAIKVRRLQDRVKMDGISMFRWSRLLTP